MKSYEVLKETVNKVGAKRVAAELNLSPIDLRMMNNKGNKLYRHIVITAAAIGIMSGWVEFGLAAESPAIEFTHIPAYESPDDLTGQVSNVNYPDYRVAVYIYIGGWWSKPTFANPLSIIQTDGTWACDITTGGSDIYATQIAAYLVSANYDPPLAAGWSQLPDTLKSNALAQVRITRPFSRNLSFSNYGWSVKDSHGAQTGPGNNYFSDSVSNVWTDAQGSLHMKICKRADIWSCAELVSQRSFGYGTYRIFLDSTADNIDTNVVLGLFTWNDDAPYAHREIDVELSRWGSVTDTNNAQFVVQPWDQAEHLKRYRIPPSITNSTHSFTWHSNRIDYISHEGHFTLPPSSNTVVFQWSFTETNEVPQTGGENFRINLWLNNTSGTTDGEDEEIIINRFAFIPYPLPQPVWADAQWTSNSEFSLTSTAEPQVAYRLQTSTNLTDWSTHSTLTPTNDTLNFTDAQSLHPPRLFYRLSIPDQ